MTLASNNRLVCSERFVSRRGAAALECAIVLPVIMLLILGCVDFGRVAYFSILVNSAAGAGMTYATTHRYTAMTQGIWEEQLRLAIREELQALPNFSEEVMFCSVATSENHNETVSISLVVRYPFKTIVNWPGIPREVQLKHRLVGNQYR